MVAPPVVAQVSERVCNLVLGCYYSAGILPTALKQELSLTSLPNLPATQLSLDLTLDRPTVELKQADGGRVRLHVALVGRVSARMAGAAPLVGELSVHFVLRVAPSVQVLEQRSVQVGLQLDGAEVESFSWKAPGIIVSRAYASVLSSDPLKRELLRFLARIGPAQARMTPQLLDDLGRQRISLDGAAVHILDGAISVGAQIQGQIAGDLAGVGNWLAPKEELMVAVSGSLLASLPRSPLDAIDAILANAKASDGIDIDRGSLGLSLIPLAGYLVTGKATKAGVEVDFSVLAIPIVDKVRDRVVLDIKKPEIDLPLWLDILLGLGAVLSFGAGGLLAACLYAAILVVLSSVLGKALGRVDEEQDRDGRRTHGLSLPGAGGATVTLAVESIQNAYPPALGLLGFTPWLYTRVGSSVKVGSSQHDGRIFGLRVVSPARLDKHAGYRLVLPPGLAHPNEPRVRVEWQLVGSLNGKPGALIASMSARLTKREARWQLPTTTPAGHFVLRAVVVRDEWDGRCTQLCFAARPISVVERLDLTRPYVRWRYATSRPVRRSMPAGASGANEQLLAGFRCFERTSQIHLTDPARRCRDADQASENVHPKDFAYTSQLPFPEAELAQHEKELCHACFHLR